MTQPAELRANYFVLADFGGREVNRNRQAGDGVLLQAEFTDVKIVDNVLGVEDQFDLAIYWNRERWDYDVVFSGRIVGIDSEWIAGRSADLFGVNAAELSVGTGIAEVECELVCGHFDLDGVGFCGDKAGFAPGFASE